MLWVDVRGVYQSPVNRIVQWARMWAGSCRPEGQQREGRLSVASEPDGKHQLSKCFCAELLDSGLDLGSMCRKLGPVQVSLELCLSVRGRACE